MVTIQIMNRKYYVREGHTAEQIAQSFVKQINDDKNTLYVAKMTGKDSFTTHCPVIEFKAELRFN